jgi:hypothetical protein
MYFGDLTPYGYLRPLEPNKMTLNVGWLDDQHDFPKGDVPEEVLANIFILCKTPVQKTRGAHSCQFCFEKRWGCVAARDGVELGIGSGEIRVPGSSGMIYASPCMIYHYISEHHYKPPQQFIEAVLRLARSDSKE